MKSVTINIILAIFVFAINIYSVEFNVHGGAWVDYGKIMDVSDTLLEGAVAQTTSLNVKGNALQSIGAQFTILTDISDNLQAAMGFGSHKVTHARGKGPTSFLAISLFQAFIANSYLKYHSEVGVNSQINFTVGSFQDKYQSRAHNLGLYLHRGPVYPGVLMGGFGDFYTDTTKSPLLGIKLGHKLGGFQHQIVLNSERDIPPTFDWSLSYLASQQIGSFLKIGGGINFYRLVPYNKDLMTPGHLSAGELNFKPQNHFELDTISLDTITGNVVEDTVFFTHQGAKLTSFFEMDFKSLFGMDNEHVNDMVLYGEIGVLGIKDYGKVYGNIKERIPVMFGFNFPTFGILDLFSVEVEWYGAKYKQDLALVGNNNVVADWTIKGTVTPSPKPVGYETYGIENGIWINNGDTVNVLGTSMDVENLTTDDLKWSVALQKKVAEKISFFLQVANDHYRPKPVSTGLISSKGGTAPAFSDIKDWYFMFRTSYFF